MIQNKSKQDAHDRMLLSRPGMLAGTCSEEYLTELRQICYQMIDGIEACLNESARRGEAL